MEDKKVARIYGIKKKLAEQNIEEKLINEIIGNGDLVNIVIRMENLLDPEITYQIFDTCACGTSRKEINGLKTISAETLEERITNIPNLEDFHKDWIVNLNKDNTLTAGWNIKDGDNYACVCSAAVKGKTKVSDLIHEGRVMPLNYCICCAGHCRRHLEKLLDIQLKTKEITSSPINSYGKKPCQFILEIT